MSSQELSLSARIPDRATFWKTLVHVGPGIVTGASDDDPSGIAAYSQAGAQYGFGVLWMAIFPTR